MKLAPCLFLFATIANAQQLPQVSPQVAVDVNVGTVQWHPHGNVMLYEKAAREGKELGIYALGQLEGDVVIRLGKNDRYESQWFEGQAAALVFVYRDVNRNGAAEVEASVYLADATTGEAPVIWTDYFPAKDGVDLDVDTSPRFRHAILRVKSGQARYHLVLPSGGNRLLASRDLDRATNEGFSGPIWSTDGTAIFNKSAEQALTLISKDLALVDKIEAVRFSVTLDLGSKITEGTTKLWIASPPPPPVGSTVLELMASNATLRQVRFKGAWEWKAFEKEEWEITAKPTNLAYGNANGIANSLWLFHSKNKSKGILIAEHGTHPKFAPRNSAVTYQVNGALFVRELSAQQR